MNSEFTSFVNILFQSDALCNWIGTNFLRGWLKGELDRAMERPKIDNKVLLCEHNKLSPERLKDMKRISPRFWNHLVREYGNIGPVLDQNSYCWDCVNSYYAGSSLFLFSLPIFTANSAKELQDQHDAAKKGLLDLIEAKTTGKGKTYLIAKKWVTKLKRADSIEQVEDKKVNTDLLCEHEWLSPEQKRNAIPVSSKAWKEIKAYFPEAIAFEPTTEPCSVRLARVFVITLAHDLLYRNARSSNVKRSACQAWLSVIVRKSPRRPSA